MGNDIVSMLKKLDLRIDDIEKLLQLLLVNHLIDDAEQIIKVSDETIISNLQETLNRYGVECGGFKSINDIDVLIIEIPEDIKIKAKDLATICSEIKRDYTDKEPLLMFKSINGMQRKRILQEGISFGVQGKELHIASRGIKK